MEFWAVVGDGNTRKTATVRALTGVGRVEAGWSVRIGSDPPEGAKAIVYVKLPQEGGTKHLPAQLVAEVLAYRAATGPTAWFCHCATMASEPIPTPRPISIISFMLPAGRAKASRSPLPAPSVLS